MASVLIGCGGWEYFGVGNLDPLEWYAKAYDFVEVNSTFYTVPNIQTVESWRNRVTEGFEFTVKGHKDITHTYKLSPQKECFERFEEMKKICATIKSEILILETPPSFDIGESIDTVEDFFSSVNKENLRIAWEMRCYKNKEVPQKVMNLMLDFDMIHCVDLSSSKPAFESNISYSRLFGKGESNIYQFSDQELAKLNGELESIGSKKKLINFHGVRMYKDAARLLVFRKTSKFPKVTKSTGQKSLEEVLMEDSKFPIPKQELIEKQGWKLFDLTEEKRIRVSEILEKIPNKIYGNLNDLLKQIEI